MPEFRECGPQEDFLRTTAENKFQTTKMTKDIDYRL